MGLVLGIDTSSYTTSLALMNQQGILIKDLRIMMEIPPGQQGIQQSRALFLHLKNLPGLVEALPSEVKEELVALCVSTRPRPVEGSYLPVFLAGEVLGRSLSSMLQVNYYSTSHQEGHIMALLWALDLSRETFLACHFSGGTTEIHRVQRTGPFLNMQCLSQSLDLYAGQLVDRIGVRLGLPFPAGPALEELARKSQGEVYSLPVAIKDGHMSFSGPEAAALRAVDAGVEPASLAQGVQLLIKETVQGILARLVQETGIETILLLGGVFSNQYLTSSLERDLAQEGMDVLFCSPKYSRDAAVGQAFQGLQYFLEQSQ